MALSNQKTGDRGRTVAQHLEQEPSRALSRMTEGAFPTHKRRRHGQRRARGPGSLSALTRVNHCGLEGCRSNQRGFPRHRGPQT